MLIDTHAAVRELEAAGMDTAQAEAVVRTIARTEVELSTKADIDARGAAIQTNIERLNERIDSIRWEMRWMLGFVAALVLAIAGRLFGLV